MNSRTKFILTGLAGLASAAAVQPALAQTAAAPAAQASAQSSIVPGATIKDTQGGQVGTVTRVDGDFVVLRTDKHEARLPVASFTPHEGSLLVAMTRDQLNAEVEKTMAQAQAQMVVGATVTGSQGSTVGTIEKLDDEFVTLKLSSGTLVRLPRSGVAPSANGVVIGMTAAQLEAAAGTN